MITQWLGDRWLSFVAILMLAGLFLPVYGVIGELPYAYYQIMNWIVVGAAVVVALQAYRKGRSALAWLFAFVAVVFNPVAPLYFTSTAWLIVDAVAAVLFVLALFAIRTRTK